MSTIGEVQKQDFEIYRGGSFNITISMKDNDAVVIPFETSQTLHFAMKLKREQDTIDLDIEVTDFEVDGSAIIPILPENTATLTATSYLYDIIWEKSATEIHPILTGYFKLIQGTTEEVTP